MVEITLTLAQSPQSPKADFLATTRILPSSPSQQQQQQQQQHSETIPTTLRLDTYTRSPWSLASFPPSPSSSNDESTSWKSLWLQSTDGRHKLPGFLKFLQQRKKSALGKFTPEDDCEWAVRDEDTGEIVQGVFVVPFDQPKRRDKGGGGGGGGGGEEVYVKYCLDARGWKEEVPPAASAAQRPQQQQQKVKRPTPKPNGAAVVPLRKPTNQVRPKPKPTSSSSSSSSSSSGGGGGLFSRMVKKATSTRPSRTPSTRTTRPTPSTTPTSSHQIISQLRTNMNRLLTQFLATPNDKTPPHSQLRIPISLSHYTNQLSSDSEKEKFGIEVVKYVVYEQVDEVGGVDAEGGDQGWVCQKEKQGEFADECVFVVYKRGCVPEDVLEDMMKGDLPDEQIQQQKAMQMAMAKEADRKARAEAEKSQRDATRAQAGLGGHLKSLNGQKRDRRSIEEIQRDLDGGGGGDLGGGGGKRARC